MTRILLPLLMLAVLACAPLAATATTTPVPATMTPVPATRTPVPTAALDVVSGAAVLPVNIRACGSMSCPILEVVRAGTPLIGVCDAGGWCYDASRRGWFWRGCIAGQPGGCAASP